MSHREDLIRAFRIEDKDLEDNLVGRLGVTQQRHLILAGYWNIATALFLSLIFGAIIYAAAVKPLAPIQWILAIAMFSALLARGIWQASRLRADVAAGRVEYLSGQVRVGSRGRKGACLVIQGQVFALPINPRNIQQGGIYHVYFVPSTQSIVAMEPMESESPFP